MPYECPMLGGPLDAGRPEPSEPTNYRGLQIRWHDWWGPYHDLWVIDEDGDGCCYRLLSTHAEIAEYEDSLT